jgi:hypothetical protein
MGRKGADVRDGSRLWARRIQPYPLHRISHPIRPILVVLLSRGDERSEFGSDREDGVGVDAIGGGFFGWFGRRGGEDMAC